MLKDNMYYCDYKYCPIPNKLIMPNTGYSFHDNVIAIYLKIEHIHRECYDKLITDNKAIIRGIK